MIPPPLAAGLLAVLAAGPPVPPGQTAPPPSPQPSSQPSPQPARLSAVDVFAIAGRAGEAGRVEEALTLYDALARDPDRDIRGEARFRKGQLLAAQGRRREAATTWRRLLDEQPGAARVRIELAALLARMGDEDGARRQLRLAQASGLLPPEVADQVARFSRALRSPQRFGGSVEATLAPDTNINRATQARTLDTVIAPLLLDRDARARSGVGLRLRGSGFAKHPVAPRVSLVARMAGAADLYRGGDADDLSGSVLLGGEWRGDRDRVGVSAGLGRRRYGGRAFAASRQVTGEWLHQAGWVTQLSATLSRAAIRYARNPLQDGVLWDAGVTGERALGARSGAAGGLGLSRQGAADPSFAAWSAGPNAYGWRDWGQVTLFANAAARRLVGDARNVLFPDKRREWFASARVGATFRQLSALGLSPTVRVGYERNASTVALYDYRRVYAEIGLSRSF